MTIAMTDTVLHISNVCTVEDAEAIASNLQEGVTSVDMTGCTHLHTAVFQLLFAARVPVCGMPANPALTRWVLPLLEAWPPAAAGAVHIPKSLSRSTE